MDSVEIRYPVRPKRISRNRLMPCRLLRSVKQQRDLLGLRKRRCYQPVQDLDWLGDDLHLGRLQAGASGGDCNRSGRETGAESNPVDPAFRIQVEIVGRIDLSAVVAAAPDARAVKREIHAGIVGGYALTFGIEDFHVDQRDVFTVGPQPLVEP